VIDIRLTPNVKKIAVSTEIFSSPWHLPFCNVKELRPLPNISQTPTENRRQPIVKN